MQNALDEIFAKLEGDEVASISAAFPPQPEAVKFVGSGAGLAPACEAVEPAAPEVGEPGQIIDPVAMKAFCLAGRATCTLRSKRSGSRYTYKITVCRKNPNLHFVAVMYGSDNENEFAYIGTIRDGREFSHGRKSIIRKDDKRVEGFTWFWKRAMATDHHADLTAALEFWHEGRCCRCGRKLTVPESIASGVGPECASRMEGF